MYEHLFYISLIIILIIILYSVYSDIYEYNYLGYYGLWVMDSEFCEQSGLSNGLLYITKTGAYLILEDNDNQIIFSDPIKIEQLTNFSANLQCDNVIDIEVTANNKAIKQIYPNVMQLILSNVNGYMIWKSNNKTMAIFVKTPNL